MPFVDEGVKWLRNDRHNTTYSRADVGGETTSRLGSMGARMCWRTWVNWLRSIRCSSGDVRCLYRMDVLLMVRLMRLLSGVVLSMCFERIAAWKAERRIVIFEVDHALMCALAQGAVA